MTPEVYPGKLEIMISIRVTCGALGAALILIVVYACKFALFD